MTKCRTRCEYYVRKVSLLNHCKFHIRVNDELFYGPFATGTRWNNLIGSDPWPDQYYSVRVVRMYVLLYSGVEIPGG